MKNTLEHKFSIRRVQKATDEEYITALRIYNETTPFEIRTETNEITYWLSQNPDNELFELYMFVLYLDDKMIGLSMTTYIKRTKIVVDEYLAVLEQYRINTIFLIYLSLIQSYYKEHNIEYSYYVTEISNKNSGNDINRESQISLKVLCTDEFGKVNAPYYTLPLGLDNHESNFEAILYIKTNDSIKNVSKETYLQIVKSIYYDYSYTWYKKFLSIDELQKYHQEVDRNYNLILQKVSQEDIINVVNSNCVALNSSIISEQTAGTIPIRKRGKWKNIILICIAILVLPLLIILGYSKILDLTGIPTSVTTTVLGSVISVIVTSLTTLYISDKK
mgnify:CR=1 FL=1